MSDSADEIGGWERLVRDNPGHSQWYIQRFKDMAADGHDLFGEARLIDAMVARRSRILDAGCGPGRIGGWLHRAGHTVVGVDVDPQLIAAAQTDEPGPEWILGDLATIDLGRTFDAIVCAGNVMTFVAPSRRARVVERLAAHLAPQGRAVVGFGANRGYGFDEFFDHVAAAGLAVDHRLATWDLRPATDSSQFLVAVLAHFEVGEQSPE